MRDQVSIIIAPHDYSGKQEVDFICDGVHDETVIQNAINECFEKDTNLLILNGIYHIDAFSDFGDGGPQTAICIPDKWREFAVKGQNHLYGFQKSYHNGVVFYVSKKALETIDDESVDVIRGEWTPSGLQNGSSLHMENVSIVLANNQHKIRCVDLRRTDRVDVKNVTLISYGDMFQKDVDFGLGLGVAPPVPAIGCIGLTMTDGSNYNYSNYTNVQTYGFDEGIQVGGEHVVCINCGAAVGRYGFTFGNYEISPSGLNHPITLINCLDERNINLPLFNKCGDQDGKGGWTQGAQEVSLISYNIERLDKLTPGGVLGEVMREVHPGTWRGAIEFTAQPAWCCTNEVNFKIWEEDGSGSGIKTINHSHKQICNTKERLSYYPMLGQQIFDTDLNKMVICLQPDIKKWVDLNGNVV